MKQYTVDVDGVVQIAGDLHCKSEEALHKLLDYLSDDYEIKDCNKDPDHPYDSYFAKLNDRVRQDYCKCDFCQSYTPKLGCRVHGYKCSACGRVMWKEYIPTAPVKFTFKADPKHLYVTLLCAGYEDGYLLLEPEPLKTGGWFDVKPENVPAFLEQYKDAYTVVERDGKKLLSFYYPSRNTFDSQEAWEAAWKDKIKIKVWAARNGESKCHYKEVILFKGVEYNGSLFGDKLPLNEYWSIYPTYKRAPLAATNEMARAIMHAAGQVTDCGYYYGRPAIYDGAINSMAKYIEHFTNLSPVDFNNAQRYFRKDGPGFIVDFSNWIAKVTGVQQYIENRPNMFNAIVGISKIASGQPLTPGEIRAAEDALADRETSEKLNDLLSDMENRK